MKYLLVCWIFCFPFSLSLTFPIFENNNSFALLMVTFFVQKLRIKGIKKRRKLLSWIGKTVCSSFSYCNLKFVQCSYIIFFFPIVFINCYGFFHNRNRHDDKLMDDVNHVFNITLIHLLLSFQLDEYRI